MSKKSKAKGLTKKAIQKALETFKMKGEELSSFLFGSPSTEIMKQGVATLFPSNDVREKTELTGRDVRACLYLILTGKWICKPFGDVAEEFMHLQISRGRMGRNEMVSILTLSNILENLPKESVAKLVLRGETPNVETQK
ncbi:MAG: hypothetical protein OEY47_01315 [Candidatus Bathyarchaeota archaeon]|nr:hypothetical protein [Candidatus Bathyarchaeota archaeon]